jgi:hypothetical protein
MKYLLVNEEPVIMPRISTMPETSANVSTTGEFQVIRFIRVPLRIIILEKRNTYGNFHDTDSLSHA